MTWKVLSGSNLEIVYCSPDDQLAQVLKPYH